MDAARPFSIYDCWIMNFFDRNRRCNKACGRRSLSTHRTGKSINLIVIKAINFWYWVYNTTFRGFGREFEVPYQAIVRQSSKKSQTPREQMQRYIPIMEDALWLSAWPRVFTVIFVQLAAISGITDIIAIVIDDTAILKK